MKLYSDLKPRADGTLILRGASGAAYQFKAGDDGVMAAEVENEADIAVALQSLNFYTAADDEADAEAIMQRVQDSRAVDGEDEDDDLPHDPNAAPIEGKKAAGKRPAAKKAAGK